MVENLKLMLEIIENVNGYLLKLDLNKRM